MSYFTDLQQAAEEVVKRLLEAGIPEHQLKFGGARELPARVRPPSFANSKFQAEQALGDWAEGCLAKAISTDVPSLKAVRYGFGSKIVAGDEGFKDHYIQGLRDTFQNGKRADLLVLPAEIECAGDISGIKTADTASIVSASVGAIEVRSSRLEALKYIEYKTKITAAGKKDKNPVPNFTVKIEDLIIVYRWIENFGKPQAYAQVFLDVVYAIGFLDILRYISQASVIKIDKPKRSGKITIMIPISSGTDIGRVSRYPKFEVVDRTTANGRHDIYAKPSNGEIKLDPAAVLSLFDQ
jgi:hypothetical protein